MSQTCQTAKYANEHFGTFGSFGRFGKFVMMPSLVFGFVLATLYGLVFYLLFGHGWWRLIFYWLVSVSGFFLGHGAAGLLGLAIFNIGELRVVEGTIVSWLSLVTIRLWRRG